MIYIASHKHLSLPNYQPYQQLFVGAHRVQKTERYRDWCYDDEGCESITDLNPYYCELTGLYWIWRNTSDPIVGLVHYRRFLSDNIDTEPPHPLTSTEIDRILDSHDCIVADSTQFDADGHAITAAEQYRRVHVSTDLIQTGLIIQQYYPDYSDAFSHVMHATSLHLCNLLICKRGLFDEYARWLFGVLERLAERIDPTYMRNTYQQRAFGYIAERLLNVYIYKHNLTTYCCRVFDPNSSNESVVKRHTESVEPLPSLHRDYSGMSTVFNGTDYSKVFDFNFYLRHYPDVLYAFSNSPQTALEHYIGYGSAELRMASPYFSVSSYMNAHPELKETCVRPIDYIQHYLSTPCSSCSFGLGFENICVSDSPRTSMPPSLLHWQKEAECYGVLD